ncbi:MAG: hypothetical protein FWG34_06905 [Oscillospiraceae bacterium]|nr:hypothetical protein [Oscillospiraceae bacterium]
MKVIKYPRKDAEYEEIWSQNALDRLTSLFFEWQQGPGEFGGLILHSCWGEISVLSRRYQGQGAGKYYYLMEGARQLYEKTGNPRWKRLAGDMCSNNLFLQNPDGGFRHSAAEFEPAYHSHQSCAIHQNMPVLALLDYAAWKHADPILRDMVKPAVDRSWEYFHKRFAYGGREHFPKMDPEIRWSGVTNQDLTVIAGLARYGEIYGDFSRYEKHGKPALELYLSPLYYYEGIGQFERGDGYNSTERTIYYYHVLDMLERIYKSAGGEHILAVMDNVCKRLFDTIFTAEDGLSHLMYGAKTDPGDKSYVVEWIKTPNMVALYPVMIYHMQNYLSRHPDAKKNARLKNLRKTAAAYMFCDGTFPPAVFTPEPILSVAYASAYFEVFWPMLIRELGERVRDPEIGPMPCIHRIAGNVTWKSRGKLWAIERDGVRAFGGYKPLAYGVTHGPDEKPADGDYGSLEDCEILEILDI